jgi:competence protein ComEA
VDVAGAVKAPGVYRLPPGSIVADAIALAGGPSADADLDRINKAVDLQDGSQVYVPSRGETRSSAPDPGGSALGTSVPPVRAAAASSLIDLNTATPEELDKLPGIGPALAQRIMEGRPYAAIEELLRVKGVGPAVYDKIKDLIAVR